MTVIGQPRPICTQPGVRPRRVNHPAALAVTLSRLAPGHVTSRITRTDLPRWAVVRHPLVSMCGSSLLAFANPLTCQECDVAERKSFVTRPVTTAFQS
jgi:hypothetical protein